MTKIYHNPRCSKSRAALAELESRDLQIKVIKYIDDTPSADEILEVIQLLGMPAGDIVRSGEARYKELKLAEQSLSDEQWAQVLADNPILIERPIVIHNDKAAIGRPLENITAIL